MEAYEIWLFLHIAAAILWVGGSTVLGVLLGRLQKAQAGPALGALGPQMEFFSKALFMPVSILAVVAGVAMVLTSDGALQFEDTWIALGLAGFLVTLVIGMGILAPTARKLGKLAPGAPEAAALQAKMKTFSGVSTAILWLIVLDMVFKPGA